jgi:hypothetical protein
MGESKSTEAVVPAKLPELLESEAPAPIKAIYEEIKQSGAVPMVALIYRHLATIPGCLEWTWAVLRPAMVSGEIPARANGLIAHIALPDAPTGEGLPALSDGDRAAIGNVLDAYNRANPMNLLAVRTIRTLLALDSPTGTGAAPAARTRPVGWNPPAPLPPLPAMVAVAELGPEVSERLAALRHPGVEDPRRFMPSLYRHLAHWPAYLIAGAAGLRPLYDQGAVHAASAALIGAADEAVAELVSALGPYDGAAGRPTGDARRRLNDTLDAFVATIPELIVVGALLRNALAEAPENGGR